MAERSTKPTPATNGNTPSRSESRRRTRERDRAPSDGTTTDSYVVVLSFGWVVRGAETGQDAINIAVSEVGRRVGAPGERTRSVDISVQRIGCHSCGTGSEALLLVSETALVGLFLEVVVDAEDPDTAEKIARREVGPHLDNTPLASVDITPAD
jgi:uncharacterized protein (UPF0212 family)